MEGSAITAPSRGRRMACARAVGGRRGQRRTARDERLCDLMEAIGHDRDHAAFTELFHELAPWVRQLLLRRGASWAVAEELMQETMLSVWRHAATFDRRRASVSTWILTIACNKQRDLARGGRRPLEGTWQSPDSGLSTALPDGEQVLHAKQSGEILHWAIRTLSRDQELVVRQAFTEAKSHHEIAVEQSLPLGTVKSRLRLALANLRTRLPMAELR